MAQILPDCPHRSDLPRRSPCDGSDSASHGWTGWTSGDPRRGRGPGSCCGGGGGGVWAIDCGCPLSWAQDAGRRDDLPGASVGLAEPNGKGRMSGTAPVERRRALRQGTEAGHAKRAGVPCRKAAFPLTAPLKKSEGPPIPEGSPPITKRLMRTSRFTEEQATGLCPLPQAGSSCDISCDHVSS